MSTRFVPCVLWAVALALPACGRDGPIAELLGGERTPHEAYSDALRRAGLDSTALGRDWLVAADSALRAPHAATLPMTEVSIYNRQDARAIAHRVEVQVGQRLQVTVQIDGIPAQIFVDLFAVTTDSMQPFEHVAFARTDSAGEAITVEYEARDSGALVVRVQPELLRDGRYTLTMRTQPVLAFPVAGHGNRAIQSRFGVARDGGARSHAGIDIFAPRGTPVLAVSDGIVRSTRPNPLGGVVVWLHDAPRRQSVYYAHLDRHAVIEGQQVGVGDTIGFVGNTGNAITTPPHLHFGIYRGRGGAIDPYPWVARTDTAPTRVTADTSRLGRQVVSRTRGVTLRAGPAANQPLTLEVARDESLEVMAAVAAWYRVQRVDGSEGYLRAGVVRDATP